MVQSIKLITKQASEKVLRFAFQYASDIGRKRVTVVHKATIMYHPGVPWIPAFPDENEGNLGFLGHS